MLDKECKRLCGVCRQHHQYHTSIYVPTIELLMEPDNIENGPKIPETLSIFKLTRSLNEDNNFFIDLFRVANDDDPLFTQLYRNGDDPERYGHKDLPLLLDVDQTCATLRRKRKAIGCNVS